MKYQATSQGIELSSIPCDRAGTSQNLLRCDLAMYCEPGLRLMWYHSPAVGPYSKKCRASGYTSDTEKPL